MACPDTPDLNSEKLFDRQTQLFGKEVQERILKSTVFLQRLNPILSEVAKNAVLQGFNLVLNDDACLTEVDLKKNLLVSETHRDRMQSRRLDILMPLLKELNPLVSITPFMNVLGTFEEVHGCQVAFLTPKDREEWEIWSHQLATYQGDVLVLMAVEGKYIAVFGNPDRPIWGPKLLESLTEYQEYCPASTGVFQAALVANTPLCPEADLPYVLSTVFGSILNQILLSIIMKKQRRQRLVIFDAIGEAPDHIDSSNYWAF